MPIGALIAWIFGEKLRSPAQDIGTEDIHQAVHDLAAANVIGEERRVKMPVIIADIRISRFCRFFLVYRVGAVDQAETLAPPQGFHFFRLIYLERFDVALSLEFRDLLRSQRKAWTLRLNFQLLCGVLHDGIS